MNSNTSLATKYRPRTFSEVVGQDSAVSVLKKFASDSVGIPVRSIFLKGSWGSGKCIRGSQRISTENGYLPIKELLPDLVYPTIQDREKMIDLVNASIEIENEAIKRFEKENFEKSL